MTAIIIFCSIEQKMILKHRFLKSLAFFLVIAAADRTFVLLVHGQSHFGYGVFDSRYFKHGTQRHEIDGGSCLDFLKLNGLDKCCSERDDDCYMVHYDTRCYCDIFCDRNQIQDHSDCCPDAFETCSDQTTKKPTSN